MTNKNAQYIKTFKDKLTFAGLLRKEYWCYPDTHKKMKDMEKEDREKAGV